MRRGLHRALLALFLAPPAPAREPPAIVLVALDTSGSIGGPERAQARNLALALLEALPPGSEAAVLTFDDQSRLVVERTTNPAPVRDAIMAARATGRFTALHDAIYDASRYLREAPDARKAIVLLTDGRDENSALNLDDGLAVATGSGIPVLTIGMGHQEERNLRRIAKLTGGDYFALADASAGMLADFIASLPAHASRPPTTVAPAAAPEEAPAQAAETPWKRWRGALWLLLVGGVLVAGVLLALGLSRRGTASGPAGPSAHDAEEPASSATVIGRMESNEEYLEKTITLSDTPALVVRGGPQSGQYYALTETSITCVGRAKANDVVLDDVSISAQHCRVRFEDGRFVLHDLKSTNGTFVNEQRVSRHALEPGDVVKLGETQLLFKMDRRKV
ncbi:MAG TPA: FHA domain-containing protein [Vicinamibacteria bacterium]|nr:FHA domain-containing protein [Vicinamibacteria bacterium]